ncbi:ATPase, T2SS/T4P/T4SS family [Polycladomyces subterraneus]|uniref:Type IV pilus twitching motility protein PilT n=1 Tax=Polycladomyces subterraneus TaxID=1016997 RepID=A0ABT8IMG2_9BACL|nr:ATPase, T2SS/T4P/T4SS family [Polycladomyces subterraneus]MDN4593937.1 type IV pilus twitching motility protein PilT [Polycladomyces subterraneus]
MNTHDALRIITLEDPIEYRQTPWRSMIEQREVGCDTTGFEGGLYAALRQDPDCLVVGELRDRETMHTAIRAAETGRLVLATMHAADTVSAVYRLIDAFPADQQSYCPHAVVRTIGRCGCATADAPKRGRRPCGCI